MNEVDRAFQRAIISILKTVAPIWIGAAVLLAGFRLLRGDSLHSQLGTVLLLPVWICIPLIVPLAIWGIVKLFALARDRS